VHLILVDYQGQDTKVKDGMEAGMRKLFENPYKEELARGGEALTLEAAQRILFFPTLTDMQYYVEVFARETPESTARREQMMKFKMMSVFYTLHRRDAALMDRFMHLGGLDSLVALLADQHRVIQSQTVELIMELLSPLMQLPAISSSRQAHLHHQVFVCLRSRSFWANISRIVAEPHEVFPKSHASSVRILAGALGWLRPEESGAKQRPDIEPPPPIEDAREALELFLESPAYRAAMPDVRGLAEDLFEELRQGVHCRPDPLKGKELAVAREAIFLADAQAREVAAHAWQSFRQMGNTVFKAGLFWPAEAAYRLALSEGGLAIPVSEASLIESNRALVLLRAGHPADAAAAGAAALTHDPRNAKAAYRRATALLDLASGQDCSDCVAARHAAESVAAAKLATSLEPSDPKVADLFSRTQNLADKLGPPPSVQVAFTSPRAYPPAREEVLDGMD